ncbi:multidrug resistance efflux transporter family protein, partial [Pseudomonas sp. FW305-BF6]|uniref:multidrug resistance efflux transporter family protein n=1 Tax=Pseudomonas sp. FW305-BF6 TaxID=2070673 RepID=UPI003F8FD399
MASSWQITIISGSLLAPLFFMKINTPNGIKKIRMKIPFKGLSMSLLILIGIIMMQVELATELSIKTVLIGIVPVII